MDEFALIEKLKKKMPLSNRAVLGIGATLILAVTFSFIGYGSEPPILQSSEEGVYADGKFTGTKKTHYKSNGKLCSEISYKNGERNGPSKWYSKGGQLRIEAVYKDGRQLLSKTYFPNGQLHSEESFKDGSPKEIKFYYESGKLRDEKVFEDGTLDGLFKSYYENGKLKSELVYKYGMPVEATLKEYDENGNLKR